MTIILNKVKAEFKNIICCHYVQYSVGSWHIDGLGPRGFPAKECLQPALCEGGSCNSATVLKSFNEAEPYVTLSLKKCMSSCDVMIDSSIWNVSDTLWYFHTRVTILARSPRRVITRYENPPSHRPIICPHQNIEACLYWSFEMTKPSNFWKKVNSLLTLIQETNMTLQWVGLMLSNIKSFWNFNHLLIVTCLMFNIPFDYQLSFVVLQFLETGVYYFLLYSLIYFLKACLLP